MQVDIIAGSKPNFLRIAPVIEAISRQQKKGAGINFRLIYIGQHYDKTTNGFFDFLKIAPPEISIDIPALTPAEEIAFIIVRYEKVMIAAKPDLVLFVSGSSASMACAVTARKFGHIRIGHIDAGIRSFDTYKSEEVNRVVTDSLTDYYFTSSHAANENLRHAGVPEERIFITGNTLIDTILKNAPAFRRPHIWGKLDLQARNYFIVSLTQKYNTEQPHRLKEILVTIIQAAQGLPVLIPVTPRLVTQLQGLALKAPTVHMIDNGDFLEFHFLLQHAKAVITDNTYLQEETTMMHVPCISLQKTSERPETVTAGTNELIGMTPLYIPQYMSAIFAGKWRKGNIPYMWDGRAAERIVEVIKNIKIN